MDSSLFPFRLECALLEQRRRSVTDEWLGELAFVNDWRVMEEFSRRSRKAPEWIELGLDEQYAGRKSQKPSLKAKKKNCRRVGQSPLQEGGHLATNCSLFPKGEPACCGRRRRLRLLV